MNTSRYETLTRTTEVAFPEWDEPPGQPMPVVRSWIDAATAVGVREPRALALATADTQGRASTRIVAITSVTDRGVVFTTHSSSQKGRELAANPWASGVLYWRETAQQLVLSGPVSRLSDAESFRLWVARPIPLHAMSVVSHQSEPLCDVDRMRAEVASLEGQGMQLPRPERFVGYRLEPAIVEFWCARPDRLHHRLRYVHTDQGWRATRLQP